MIKVLNSGLHAIQEGWLYVFQRHTIKNDVIRNNIFFVQSKHPLKRFHCTTSKRVSAWQFYSIKETQFLDKNSSL